MKKNLNDGNVKKGTNNELCVVVKAGELPCPKAELKPLGSNQLTKIYDFKLLHGEHRDSKRPTIGVEMTCKRFDVKITFLAKDLLDANKAKGIIEELVEIYPLRDYTCDLLLDVIEDLLLTTEPTKMNLSECVDNMPASLESDEYLTSIITYMKENREEIVSKSSGKYFEDKDSYNFVLLDTQEDIQRYGEGAVAIKPDFLRNKIFITDEGIQISTLKYSSIITSMNSMGIIYFVGSVKIDKRHNITLSNISNLKTKMYIFKLGEVKE